MTVVPWGRLNYVLRKDLILAQRPISEGGTGQAEQFWEWCDKQVEPYQ